MAVGNLFSCLKQTTTSKNDNAIFLGAQPWAMGPQGPWGPALGPWAPRALGAQPRGHGPPRPLGPSPGATGPPGPSGPWKILTWWSPIQHFSYRLQMAHRHIYIYIYIYTHRHKAHKVMV